MTAMLEISKQRELNDVSYFFNADMVMLTMFALVC